MEIEASTFFIQFQRSFYIILTLNNIIRTQSVVNQIWQDARRQATSLCDVCAFLTFRLDGRLVTFIVFFAAFPGSSADGPSIALSINVVSAHQPAAWHDRPGDPRRNIFGQYLCKTFGSSRHLSFLRDVGNMVIKIDPCFPSNLSKQLTCKQHGTVSRPVSFVSIAVVFSIAWKFA